MRVCYSFCFFKQKTAYEITTIEGLAAHGRLHPLQEAFRENHGLQCGFCTPGVVLAASELLRVNPKPTEEEIRVAISGNLCRCTGYVNIVKSVSAAASRAGGGGGHGAVDGRVRPAHGRRAVPDGAWRLRREHASCGYRGREVRAGHVCARPPT